MLKFGEDGVTGTLYHTGPETVKVPEIRRIGKPKDFGWGFYTTEIKKQAESYATRSRMNGRGVITEYKYYSDRLDNLAIKRFTETDEEWLDFIVYCRDGNSHNYDMVEGPMADDEVWDLIEFVMDGSLSKDKALEEIRFHYRTHQICFLTTEALESIEYEKERTIYGNYRKR